MSIQQHDNTLLGAYVLGVLDEREVRTVDEHVEACGDCRLELAALEKMESTLGEVPPEAFLEGPPEGGELLLGRTLRQADTERTRAGARRRAVVGAVAAVAAAAVLGGGFLFGRGTADHEVAEPDREAVPTATLPVEGTRFASATDPGTGARIAVRMTPAVDWVRVNAAVSGIPAGERCRLVVVAGDGTREIAGSWLVAGAEKGANLDGSAAVPPEDVKEILVENDKGKQYVSAHIV
ncbi:anti-sigma factor [Streptomyces sp. SID4919]|uniref:anti-sigma factor family protein n=1 Tax=unclassified Streptomyces TaxID=2593676 RepID=UPI000823C19F|nr:MULTISPECIES: zf-HC2 domain-containing protein [unclassified Streptomyces]MYY07668.1 anti-sigma factor [Streptomyces sp. SID4919]SCK52808.1 Putative zinc-finger [Streptomyces sp. AmelKG-E11A]